MVYRLVSSIWVMTVTPAVTNVLLCTQLIAATARLLVAACKGVDVTPDKIARKYPEVWHSRPPDALPRLVDCKIIAIATKKSSI